MLMMATSILQRKVSVNVNVNVNANVNVNDGNHHLAEESQCCRFCFAPSQTLAELAISAGKIKVDDNDDILTPRLRDSYCSCCVTEKTG